MMMKIGYSSSVWDGGTSGMGIYLSEHLKILAKREDIDLRILAFGGEVLEHPDQIATSSTGPGIARIKAPVQDILWHRNRIGKAATAENLDLIQVPTIRRLPGAAPCPRVVTVHDLAPMRYAGKYGLLRGFYHRNIVGNWLSSVDGIITVSESTKRDIIHFYGRDPDSIRVVPNGIDQTRFTVGDKGESQLIASNVLGSERPYLLYVSRLEHPSKNHVRLIEAFRKVQGKIDQRLVLVGKDWHGSEIIHETAADLVASGAVQFTDFVESEDLPHLIRAADAMVYPSLFEGFGLPVLEAMACGTAVACSDSSSLTEVASGHALLFDPEDTNAIAESILEIANSADLRRQLSGEAAPHAAKFTWEASVQNTIDVWRDVTEARKKRSPIVSQQPATT